MKTLFAASLTAAALLGTASTADAQLHGLDWHGPGILKGGDDDRGVNVIGGSLYYGGHGGYYYGYPTYITPYPYGYGYGAPTYPYGGYGYGYPRYGYGYPVYGYGYYGW